MSRNRKRTKRRSRRKALDRLARLIERVRSEVEARRAFSCEGCEAHCCRVGRNGMLVTRLETQGILERMERDAGLASVGDELAARIADTARTLLDDPGPEIPTYDCPFLGEDNRCRIHGRGQPLGCVTFMPVEGDRCDHREDAFVEAFEELIAIQTVWLGEEDREGELLPIEVDEALDLRAWGRIVRARGTPEGTEK